MRIIAIGDVVGRAGTDYACEQLPLIRSKENADLIIVNAENSAGGSGLTPKNAEQLLRSGADVLTGGNHTLRRKDLYTMLDESDYVLRPHNLPPGAPGKGCTIVRCKEGLRVMVINLIGQIFMDPADNPFNMADRLLKENKGSYDFCVCDFHGEATSEKAAFARYFDGRINIVFGTHTHVQTADETILPEGTGFISDIGMCGPIDSIIGVKPEAVIASFVTRIRDRFEPAEGQVVLRGAAFDIDKSTGKVTAVQRLIY